MPHALTGNWKKASGKPAERTAAGYVDREVLKLRGATVSRVAVEDGALVLYFDATLFLLVHNRWTIRVAAMPSRQYGDPFVLKSRTVRGIFDSPASTCFDIGGLLFCIDLAPDAWKGPEAAVLYMGNTPLAAWNR